MWRGRLAVLAFGIRVLTGRAKRFPHSRVSLRLSSQAVCATPRQSPKWSPPTMTKPQVKIDMQNPFIPSRQPICRMADTALIFAVTVAGVVAVAAALIRQIAQAI